jgi:hypothetical protein
MLRREELNLLVVGPRSAIYQSYIGKFRPAQSVHHNSKANLKGYYGLEVDFHRISTIKSGAKSNNFK